MTRLALLLVALPAPSCISLPAFRAESWEQHEPGGFIDPATVGLEDAARGTPGDLLTALPYRRVVVEVDWYEGLRPSDWALSQLVNTVELQCDKPDGVRLVMDDEIDADEHPFDGTEERVRELGMLFADGASGGDTLRLYVLVMPAIPGTSTMGTAGGALELGSEEPNFVVYRDAVAANARLHFTTNEIEAHTMVHEFGHLLGLTRNPLHHVWNDWPHCTRPECVMTGVPLSDAVWGNLFYNPFRLILGIMPKTFCISPRSAWCCCCSSSGWSCNRAACG